MCLSTVIDNNVERLNKKYPTIGYGWKVIKTTLGRIESADNHTKLCYNKWIVDKENSLIGTKFFKYNTGFHIFKTRKEARKWKQIGFPFDKERVVKVKFKDVVAEGMQSHPYSLKVIVARQIYIEGPK